MIAPHLPKPCATCRPRVAEAESVNSIFDVMRLAARSGWCRSDLPVLETICRWFAVWRDDGRFEWIKHALGMADRERVERDAPPSRSSTARVSRVPGAGGTCDYDACKKSTGASTMRWSTPTGVALQKTECPASTGGLNRPPLRPARRGCQAAHLREGRCWVTTAPLMRRQATVRD